MKKEIWKDVPGYEGIYQVSTIGNVKSFHGLKTRLMKVSLGSHGYELIKLYKNGYKKMFNIHVLMAMAFLNHEPCGYKIVVDHIDGDRLNNKIDNLQLISHRNNISKGKLNKTSKYTGVSWNKRRNKWNARIQINKKPIELGFYELELDAKKAYELALSKI